MEKDTLDKDEVPRRDFSTVEIEGQDPILKNFASGGVFEEGF